MSFGSGYNYSYIFKYIIVGDMGVGKTCLMHQFVEQKFIPDCPHTIGVEFATKVIEVNDQKVKLQIWDTAGQERFRAVTRSYYRGAACVILVFDISRKSTFNRITHWMTDARRLTCNNSVIYMVGNKVDLEDQRDVSYEEAERLAKENDLVFLECSAKQGYNVETVFNESARKIYGRVLDGCSNLNGVEVGLHSRSVIGPGGLRNTDLSTPGTSTSAGEAGRQGCSC